MNSSGWTTPELAAHVLHHDEVDAVRAVDLVHGDDIRVHERGRRARLAEEALLLHGVAREVAGEDLDGDFAIEACVVRAPHVAHAPCADMCNDLVVQELSADHDANASRTSRF